MDERVADILSVGSSHKQEGQLRSGPAQVWGFDSAVASHSPSYGIV